MSDDGNKPRALYNLVATYPDAEHARVAMTALERRGVEAERIELLGAPVASARSAPSEDRALEKDLATTGRVGRFGAVGALLGAVVGAVLAVLVYLLIGPDVGAGAVASAIGGALLGGALGGFWGGGAALPVNEQWEDTFDPAAQGPTRVAVSTDDESEFESARAALAGSHATTVEEFGPSDSTRR